MAKYNIKNINYISSDDNIVMINLDYDDGNVEKRNKTFVAETKTYDNKTINKCIVNNDDTVQFTPIYDIEDMNIKYGYVKPRDINDVDVQYTRDGKINLYANDIENAPIGFVHFPQNGYSFVLSQPTITYTKCLRTTLKENYELGKETLFYSYVIDGENNNTTYLYRTEDDLGESYEEYSKFNPSSQLFEVKYDLKNIKYNYIYYINTLYGQHEFNNGDIYGDMRKLKNVLDANYSMNITEFDDDTCNIKNCRDYCSVGCCGNDLYLTFYDNTEYSQLRHEEKDDIIEKQLQIKSPKTYPYQKVEIIKEFNAVSIDTKHRSSLFSIELSNVGLTDQDTDTTKQRIKKDIVNKIREMTRNICPSNTHLFDVYFKD